MADKDPRAVNVILYNRDQQISLMIVYIVTKEVYLHHRHTSQGIAWSFCSYR